MNKKKLTIKFPEGFMEAVSRRHYGAEHTKEEIKLAKQKIDKEYKKYNKNRDKLDLLYIEWDEKNIESYFQQPIWYNAHRKRKRYMKNMEDSRRDMFYILTNFDGNGREQYCPYNSISADEIIDSFNDNYIKGK